MNVSQLVNEIERSGISLSEEGGALRYRGPKGALTAEWRSALQENKPDVIEYLKRRESATHFTPDPGSRFERFPVTEIQKAYLLGRGNSFAYGAVGCHGYGELVFPEIDHAHLTRAWRSLIREHDMLRAVVYEDGTQQILRDTPEYEIVALDLRSLDPAEAESGLAKVRAGMDHRVYQPDRWPLFDLRTTLLPRQAVLHFSIDLLISDFVSTQLLLAQLVERFMLPSSTEPASRRFEVSFRDYVLATQTARNSDQYQADRGYWMNRIESLPPAPELPVLEGRTSQPPHFRRLDLTLAPSKWESLGSRARKCGVTPSGSVLAAFSEVLGRWSRHPRFSLNLTLQNRLPLHPDIDHLAGDFTALLLLEVDQKAGSTFGERAVALQNRLWEDLEHRSFSGSEVIREIARLQRDDNGLFPVVFTSSIGIPSPGGTSGIASLVNGITQTPQVWIDCQVIESPRGLIVNWDTREGIFPPGVIEDMFDAFRNVLESVASSDDAWNEADLVKLPATQAERRRFSNDTAAPLPALLLHEAVVSYGLQHPERTAVIGSGESLSFGDLLASAFALAKMLRDHGAEPGDLVAVALEKSSDQPVAVLGALLAGCPYVPLDVEQPALRRNQVIADAGIRFVVSRDLNWDAGEWPATVRLMPLQGLARAPLPPAMPRLQQPGDLAYVIYTSGSTGTPKGVAISHVSAVNTIVDINRRFGIRATDRVLGVSSLGFDLSVYDIFGVLAAGGCLVLPDACKRASPSHWAELIVRHGVTVWNSVPALMQALHDYLAGEGESCGELDSLRLALLSGDWIPVRLPGQIRKLIPELKLISLGGATEAAIWSIFHPITDVPPEWQSIPYGKPLANQTFHVLNGALRDCPEWVAGELYIGGAGLALGYWRDPAKTSERFIHHPATGERLYRTGDWGRYLADGSIEFMGREDRQIKIRGYRIELVEVEAGLSSYPAIGRAAVVVEGTKGSSRLAAFVEPAFKHPDPLPWEAAAWARRSSEAAVGLLPRQQHAAYAGLLQHAALLSMKFALMQWGVSEWSEENVRRTLPSFSAQQRRVVHRWIAALQQNGMLARDTPDEVDHNAVDRAWAGVAEAAKVIDESRLAASFRLAAMRLPQLAEAANLSQVIPVDEQLALLLGIYRDALPAKWARAVMSAALEPIAATRKAELRVLQFGAASPLDYRSIVASGARLNLVIADPSPHVLAETERRHAQDGNTETFALLDLDAPYRKQGFYPNSFDIIVASNILHRSRDIHAALGQVRELLRPGAWLVFNETTEDSYAVMASLELVLNIDSATGDFLDERCGQYQTFLQAGQWRDAILRAGGEPVLCLGPEQAAPGDGGMRVFAARFKADRAAVEIDELNAVAAGRLPPYMIPSQIQVVDALPVTANGKVDVKLLRSWVSRRGPAPVAAGAEASDLERRLARVWSEMLNVADIGRSQDFLSLGGESLAAARLAGRMREELPEAKPFFFDELLHQLLRGVTIAELAAMLSGSGEKAATETARHSKAPVTIRHIAGSGIPVRLMVPSDLNGPEDIPPAAEAFTGNGTMLAVRLEDQQAFLGLPPANLIPALAEICVHRLVGDGHLTIDVIGFESGTSLALELARQMMEAGGIVEQLYVVGWRPQTPDVVLDASSAPWQSRYVEGLRNWETGVYAGDITILLPLGDDAPDARAGAFWEGVGLGDVRVVSAAPNSAAGASGPVLARAAFEGQ